MPSMVEARLGRFELGKRLGSGGMGEVYRARDPSLGREVAIKRLPAAFSTDPQRLARLEQEARAASTLNHPNIVTIHEIGESQGQHFIVMELVEGEGLRQILEERPLPIEQAIDIATQAALNPRDAQVQIRLADCHAMAGRATDARETAQKALLLAPQDSNVLFMAGQIHEVLGDRSQAVKLITQALDLGLPWSEVETSPALAALQRDPHLRARARS